MMRGTGYSIFTRQFLEGKYRSTEICYDLLLPNGKWFPLIRDLERPEIII
jgi:hypothetical protein